MTRSLYLLLFLIKASCLNAQNPLNDSVYQKAAVNLAIDSFYKTIGTGAAIYNGEQHIIYPKDIIGNAYFQASDWQNENVIYDGVLYKNVRTKYDLLADILVVNRPGEMAINLYSPRISSFTLLGHNFIYKEENKSKSFKAGFYELLISGPITVLAKWSKKISEKITTSIAERKFDESVQYYILRDDVYYPIKNVNSILVASGQRKKEIKKYIRSNRIKFKRDKPGALVSIAAYYNH